MAIQDLWEFKYHPDSIDKMILSKRIRKILEKNLEEIPNMILSGNPGCGKGTYVDILTRHLECDVLRINASDETGVDCIRNKVFSFSTAAGLEKIKIVYLNEGDYLSLNAQAMLRDLIERTHDICRFIITCNYSKKIIPELKSRMRFIEFDQPNLKDIAQRCIEILKKEKIKYDTKDVINLVKQTGNDIRHTINTLQLNVINGELSSNIKVKSTSFAYEEVFKAMKMNNPSDVRKVLRSNPIDYVKLYEYLYELIMNSDEEDIFKNDAQAILLISEYLYRDNFVAINEINFMGMYVKMLTNGIL